MWFQRQAVTRSHFIIISREREQGSKNKCAYRVSKTYIYYIIKSTNTLYTKLQTNSPILAVNHLNVNHDSKPSVIDSYFMTLELSTFLNPFEIYSTQCHFHPQTHVENPEEHIALMPNIYF